MSIVHSTTLMQPSQNARKVPAATHAFSTSDQQKNAQSRCKHFTSVSPDRSGHFSPTVGAPMLGRSPLADIVSSKQAPTPDSGSREVLTHCKRTRTPRDMLRSARCMCPHTLSRLCRPCNTTRGIQLNPSRTLPRVVVRWLPPASARSSRSDAAYAKSNGCLAWSLHALVEVDNLHNHSATPP
jgi:hypothetical protein